MSKLLLRLFSSKMLNLPTFKHSHTSENDKSANFSRSEATTDASFPILPTVSTETMVEQVTEINLMSISPSATNNT